jgi:hypothetical protein
MSNPVDDRPPADRLRSLERTVLARERGERVPMPEARNSRCEICGAADVRWGALCNPCRDRLRAAMGPRPR